MPAQGSSPRKRISRACDSCNALRTKCNGAQPCQHCADTGTPCLFERVRKKRGKTAKRQLEYPSSDGLNVSSEQNHGQNQDGLQQRVPHQQQQSQLPHIDHRQARPQSQQTLLGQRRHEHNDHILGYPYGSPARSPSEPYFRDHRASTLGYEQPYFSSTQEWASILPSPSVHSFDSPQSHNQYPRSAHVVSNQAGLQPHGQGGHVALPFAAQTPFVHGPGPHLNSPFNASQVTPRSPVNVDGGRQSSEKGSITLNRMFASGAKTLSKASDQAEELKHPSPQQLYGRPPMPTMADESGVKYPILLPHLKELNFIPISVLDILLETYFENSPYVIGYVVRRSSLLHRTRPRKTSPSLLYAILCVAAHTCETAFFTNTPLTRTKTVQTLFEMAVTALRPLQHDEVGGGGLDDVITYTQLGTIIAASEFKGVSLRWFYSAWTLATELRLNRELSDSTADNMTETHKEERRRTWWLLYMIDRHLSLCYNKPLVLSDIDCVQLFRPLDESLWASDEDLDVLCDRERKSDPGANLTIRSEGSYKHDLFETRAKGVGYDVQGPSVFGFFLPLTTILGEICTLVMLRRSTLLSFDALEPQKAQVRMHLNLYHDSLLKFGQIADNQHTLENTFIAYARQLMHTMHILLCGKWDPILLMEDGDQWISSEEFVSSATHAVSAAEATAHILRLDPDLAFMPFFFGIYLLQGSFLLLLIVDKLEHATDEAVIQAAETYIRAHEVCVVTLDTQYQRNFRKVMRSMLNCIRHKVLCNEEEKTRRRDILALYRWAKDGRGLVI